MKAVLISIRPQWCELIAAGKKTVEVRKTKPKLETPFKVYIYCTKDKHGWFHFGKKQRLDGMVIGEFVCDRIYQYASDLFRSAPLEGVDISTEEMEKLSCLTAKELYKYEHSAAPRENCINLVGVYGWHISDLKIYEKPKKLGEFHFPPERYCEKGLCGRCPFDESPDVNGEYMYGCEWERPIQTPPQSWCYVEEVPADG